MNINGREIGDDKEPYVIAEISCNHCGSLDLATKLIKECADAGADAVKIQAYEPHSLTIEDIRIDGGKWDGQTYFELYERTHTPFEWIPLLFDFAKANGITLISSVFCERGLIMLEACGCPAYKIASFEAMDHELLRAVGKVGKPVIMSLGALDDGEALESTMILRQAGAQSVALLHCVSEYPTRFPQLQRIKTLRGYFQKSVPIGFSDHSSSGTLRYGSLAAMLGASIIERHVGFFNQGSDDEAWSLTPSLFEEYVYLLSDAQRILHETSADTNAPQRFSRSIYCIKDVEAGERFTRENVRVIRPGYGLHPRMLGEVLKTTALEPVKRGEPITIENANIFGGEL